MPYLVTFQNSNLDHPENGSETGRVWTGYSSRTEELLYEILYTLQNS
jgi:hypothetical protein